MFAPISIDQFFAVPGVEHYILTHFHSDHCHGLHPSWRSGILYCTPQTAALVCTRYGEALRESLVEVKYDTPTIVPTDPPMRLTFFDACHVMGSCMVLLEGTPLGTVFHTGDCRLDDEKAFSVARRLPPVDHLYIDTTWLRLKHAKFLSDEEFETEMGRLARAVLAYRGACVVRCYLMNQFGKEPLLIPLAKTLGTRIAVDERRLAYLEAAMPAARENFAPLPRREVVETPNGVAVYQRGETCGIVVVNTAEAVSEAALTAASADGTRHWGLVLSGWAAVRRRHGSKGACPFVVALPYSLHSTPHAIVRFVDAVRPATVGATQRRMGPPVALAARLRRPFANAPAVPREAPRSDPTAPPADIAARMAAAATARGVRLRAPTARLSSLDDDD